MIFQNFGFNQKYPVAAAAGGITPGYYIYYDVGNPSSYSGTGSSIYDLSGNNITGTLYNSPSYSTSNGGILSFNGSNNYITWTGRLAADFTIQWVGKWAAHPTTEQGNSMYRGVDNGFYGDQAGDYWNPIVLQGGSGTYGGDTLVTSILDWCVYTCVCTNAGGMIVYTWQPQGSITRPNPYFTTLSRGTSDSTTAYFGNDYAAGGRLFYGNFMAMVQYDFGLTEAQITANYDYFLAKF